MSSKRFFYFLLCSIFVLSLVVSPLGGFLTIAQSGDPVECFDGCHLEVFVSTYTKDANSDFTPVSQIETVTCFYVNAVVVNTGNVTADDISATIGLGSGMFLAACDSASATKYWDPADPNWQALDPAIPGRVADFWWQVCCTAPGGSQQISVTARAGTGGCLDATGYSYITRTAPEEDVKVYTEALYIEIVEPPDGFEVCAGCPPENEFPITVAVTNLTCEMLPDITVQLQGNDTASFIVVGSSFQAISELAHGSSQTVTFTGRCIAPGEVMLTASAAGVSATQTYTAGPDHVYIHQKEVMAGIESYDSEANPCQTFEIIGAYKNCYGVKLTNFQMSIIWRGDAELILSGAQQPTRNTQLGSGWLNFTSLNTTVEDLGDGWHRNTQSTIICQCCETLVKWQFNCTGDTDVEAYATVEWTGGLCQPEEQTFIDDSETVYIDQQYQSPLIVDITSPATGFEVCAYSQCTPDNEFPIEVAVTNNTGETVNNIIVQVQGDVIIYSFTVVGAPSITINSLASGNTTTVIFTGRCNAPVDITLTASAEGQGASQTYTAAPDYVYIHLKRVMAGIESYDSEANPCQTFEIIGAYKNCGGNNVIAYLSITWRGDAELILSGAQQPMWDKQLGWGWGNFTSLNTTVKDLGGGWYRNTQTAIFFPCCEDLIRWQFTCTGDTDVEAYATMEWTDPGSLVFYVDDSETVYIDQQWQSPLIVDITSPATGFEVCVGCPPENEFPITVAVTNNTCETVNNITVQLQGNDTHAFAVVGASSITIDSLAHGNTTTVSFTGRCTKAGEITLTANAGGNGTTQTYTAAPDHVYIHSKMVVAGIESYDSEANSSQTFEIIGAYKNCSGMALAGLKQSITWRGDAELILSGAQRPMYDHQLGEGWSNFTFLNTAVEDLGSGWHRNTQTGVICQCCEFLVKWQFNCTGDTDVEDYATVEWTGYDWQGAVITYTDDSEIVEITQQWNAHLIVGLVPFLQDEDGCMWNRNAFVPGQDFHVVLPVVNVGHGEAQDVQVTFRIPSDPYRWDFVSISGDVGTRSWDEATATGVATIPSVPGDSVKKVIVQLHCAGGGPIQFDILSVTGADGVWTTLSFQTWPTPTPTPTSTPAPTPTLIPTPTLTPTLTPPPTPTPTPPITPGAAQVIRDLPADAQSPGTIFDVTVTFTAPNDDFNAIGLEDTVPAGWTIQSDETWCVPEANFANVAGDQVQYTWFGPYSSGETFTALYKVTVPPDASTGSYAFNGQLGYEIGSGGTVFEIIAGDSTVQVSQNITVSGIVREVNGNILPGVIVTLNGAGAAVSDENGYYEITTEATCCYMLTAHKGGFRDRTITIITAGSSPFYNVTFNFQGQHGLIPNAPDMGYALDCVNLWLYPPDPDTGLDMWTALTVVNAWLYPISE